MCNCSTWCFIYHVCSIDYLVEVVRPVDVTVPSTKVKLNSNKNAFQFEDPSQKSKYIHFDLDLEMTFTLVTILIRNVCHNKMVGVQQSAWLAHFTSDLDFDSVTLTVADPGFLCGGGGGDMDQLGHMALRHGCFSVKMYAKTKELGPIGGHAVI